MSTPRSDEILFAAGGDVWTKYGTFVRRTLPEEEVGSHSRSSVGSFRDRSLHLREAESGVLRPTWIEGESEYAARLEASRTNELTRSEALDHGDWSKNLVTVNDDQADGPGGATSLDEIVEDGGTGAHRATQAVTGMTADTDYALSCWAIADTREWIRLGVRETADATNRVRAWFDLSSGATGTTDDNGTGSFRRSYIEDWTDTVSGLYRVVLVGSVGNGATSLSVDLVLARSDGEVSYTGDGSSSLYAGYAGLEDDVRAASSYISTTDSTVTRNDDNFSVNFAHAPRAMTVYTKFRDLETAFSGGGDRWWHVGGPDSGDTPRLLLVSSTVDGQIRFFYEDSGGSVESALTALSFRDIVEARGVLFRDGSEWKVQLHVSTNGGSETSGSQATIGTSLPSAWSAKTLTIGAAPGGSSAGVSDFISIVASPGDRTMQEMRDIEL